MPQQYNFDINSAIKAGYTPDQIAQYLDAQKKQGNSYQLTQSPQATPQQSVQPAQPKSNFLLDALPTAGSILGGIGGALIPGLGETGVGEIGGAAVGGAAGEGLKELITGQKLSPQDIATQGVMGGVGGAVGKGVGYVVGKVLPKIASAAPALEDVSTGLKQGTRQIRVKPSVYGASKEQTINSTLDKYGIAGTAQQQYSQLAPAIQKIEGQISDITQNNPDTGASMQDIKDSFMNNLESNIRSGDLTKQQAQDEIDGYLADLKKASKVNNIDTSDQYAIKRSSLQSQIKGIETTMNDISINGTNANGRMYEADLPSLDKQRTNLKDQLSQLPSAPQQPSSNLPKDFISLMQLRDMKKIMNKDLGSIQKTVDNNGSLSARQKVIQEAWGSLDDAVKNASPEVKGLLTDESNIYGAAQSLSRARSNPPTLRVAGTSVPATVTQTGREIGAGAASLASKGISNIPGGLSPILSQSAGQGIARTLLPATPEQASQNAQNGQNYPQDSSQANESQYNSSGNFNQNNALPSSPQAAFTGNNSTINSQQSQALPASPQDAFGGTGNATAKNPLKGYTINGKPIDPATANLIQKIATYQIDPTKMTSLRNNERERMISLVSQFDPSYDSTSYPAKAKVREDFTSGKSAQNIRSLNTAVSHLSALADAGGALGNTSFTPFNQVKNNISQATGQPQVTRFNDALNAVAGEMSTVFKGSSGTDQEINSWKEQMGAAQSPAQIQAGINQMVELMTGRLQALESQYQTGMGKPADFSFLNPNAQRILQKFGIDPTTLANPNALPASPQ